MQRMYPHDLETIIAQLQKKSNLFLDKVRQLSAADFVLEFSQGQNLFFSLNNRTPFIALNVDINEFPGGGALRAFAIELRQHLSGRLVAFNLVNNDAIIKLDFARRNNLLDIEIVSLVIELIPTQPQCLLINTDNLILSAFRYLSSSQSDRLIQKGSFYEAPENIREQNEVKASPIDFYEAYHKDYKALIFKQNYEPLIAYLKVTTKKLNRLITNYKNDLLKLSEMPLLYHHANLLLMHKPAILGETVQIDGEMIPVDTRLNAIQNADLLFKKAKKLKKSEEILKTRILEVENQIAYLENIQNQVALQPSHEDMMAIYNELGLIKTKAKKELITKLNPYFIDYKNTRILFGKNNQQNDHLTHKIARKTDTFMHIKNSPGAHIIITGSNHQKDVLEFCGQLALYLSKKIDGEVSYIPVKTIKKGPLPGQVILRNEKTFYLRFDPQYESVFRNEIRRIK
jgi:predicted ribosome quality control (RQC) complex YloA/Tae2 family protein